MKQQVCESFRASFSMMSREEIVAQFDGWDFRDAQGHPLRNFLPFLVLAELAAGRGGVKED